MIQDKKHVYTTNGEWKVVEVGTSDCKLNKWQKCGKKQTRSNRIKAIVY